MPAEYAVDWTAAMAAPSVPVAVDRARMEHMRFVASVRSREGVVAGYILRIEGQLFACSNNAAWLRDFFAKLPDAKPAGD